jgi:hypothetical protein
VSVTLAAAFRILREGSYLRDLALVLGLVLSPGPCSTSASAPRPPPACPTGPALVSFFALYQAGVGLAVLLAQSLLALIVPGLPSLLLVRSTEALLSSSLFRSGYELLFTPIPPKRKRPIKTLVDVGFDKLGSVRGSLLTLVVVAALQMGALRVPVGLAVLGRDRVARGHEAAAPGLRGRPRGQPALGGVEARDPGSQRRHHALPRVAPARSRDPAARG